MKMQIKNSHKVIIAITFLFGLLFITAFKAKKNMEQTRNAPGFQTRVRPLYIDIRILVMSDKVEAIKEFITGWREVQE
jgi:hypothetical protein